MVPLERRLKGRVTFLSDPDGSLLDALGVRHEDGVPWYDRLLFKLSRHDIALPVTLLVDKGGRIAWAYRSARVDDRPPVPVILDAWRRARAAGEGAV